MVKTPILVSTLVSVHPKHLYVGAECSFVLTQCGEVYSWGSGLNYLHGHSHQDTLTVPTLIADLKHKKVKQISVGESQCLAVTEDGHLYTWGQCSDSSCDVTPSRFYSVSNMIFHPAAKFEFMRVDIDCAIVKMASHIRADRALVLSEDGEVYNLGDSSFHADSIDSTRTQLDIVKVFFVNDHVKIKYIACGDNYCAAINELGEVYTWGNNSDGRLGQGHDTHAVLPVQIKIPSGKFKIPSSKFKIASVQI
ncbi:ultraviolet-B receptor UVR8-like [Diaphorina citri]|uniref:Ultraviolet-B receptor UVR8-like n=1 Tax=Diaphorina citri TaxID=121845 RepID=A0A3Q0IW08_DIACI|nr:ultraviolet-B receptor UVR8-like [Diaphorina citri]